MADRAASRNIELRDHNAKCFAKIVRRDEAHFSVRPLGTDDRQRILEQRSNRLAQELRFGALEQFLSRGVYQGDAAIETGCDQPVTGGLNDVLVQRLQVLKGATRMLKAGISLAKLCGKKSREVRDRRVSKQVYENDRLQCTDTRVRRRVGRDNLEVAQLEYCSVKNERQRCSQVTPHAVQQNACNYDHEWVKKIERAV